ncbi:hypothetical protein K438DRAFT_2014781 [Mycena galopus ATCC 62051]|nr:hypothetical protein K438DRAFT_2014781 [Mycena galopus ATCC 62051]
MFSPVRSSPQVGFSWIPSRCKPSILKCSQWHCLAAQLPQTFLLSATVTRRCQSIQVHSSPAFLNASSRRLRVVLESSLPSFMPFPAYPSKPYALLQAFSSKPTTSPLPDANGQHKHIVTRAVGGPSDLAHIKAARAAQKAAAAVAAAPTSVA